MRIAIALLLLISFAHADDIDARLTDRHSKDHPTTFTADFPDRAAWEARAGRLRIQVLVSQGLWPMPEKTPMDPQIYGTIDRDAYTIEKVYFRSQPGHYVTGNLYRPKSRTGKLPAVLCPYGHWPDGRFIWKNEAAIKKEIDSGAETDPTAAKTPLQANCAMLARMGCVVFQYDMVGYGDSTVIKHKEGFTDVEAVLRGQSFMGLQTWNGIRAFDFLASLPDVDPSRIAVTGSSSGGTQAIVLNAADNRAAVSFPMVMVSMNMQGGCICENAPLYRVGTNNVELASLFAPKPQGMAAANDWTRDFMTRGLPEMKHIWGLYNAADDVWGEHYNFGHNHNLHSRLAQYEFLNRHLKLGYTTPIKEEPFVPVEPKDLSVWDAAHPIPADFLNAAELRKKMTAASDAQLAKLTDEQFAAVVRPALKAMIADDLPSVEQIETGDRWIARRGETERVRAFWIRPKQWNGEVTVYVDLHRLDAGESEEAALEVDTYDRPQPGATQPTTSTSDYLGFTLGYNRSLLARRVHNLLTTITFLQHVQGARRIWLCALGDESSAAALIAASVANDETYAVSVNLEKFDFDQIHDPADPRLLPCILKYGGIDAIASIRTSRTVLGNPPQGMARSRRNSDVELQSSDQ